MGVESGIGYERQESGAEAMDFGRFAAAQCLVTPADVHNQVFSTVRLREGYDLAEVDAFLGRVETTIARLLHDNERLAARLAPVVADDASASAARVIALAQRSADQISAEARQQAQQIIADARAHADEIQRGAAEAAAAMDRDTRDRCHVAMQRLKALLEDLEGPPATTGSAEVNGPVLVPAQHHARHGDPAFDRFVPD